MTCRRIAGAILAAVLTVQPLAAQPEREMFVVSPVLTVDQDALFERSAFGRRMQVEIEVAAAALAVENRAIEAELGEEERQLTERRSEMDPEAFRELASAFDAKVVEIRRTQDQKGRDISRRPDEAREEFFRAAVPVLAEIVRERRAVAILDTRAVILSADAIDITEEAIRRIDDRLGDGTGLAPPAGGSATGGDAADPDEAGPAPTPP